MGFEIAYDPAENIKIVTAVQKYPVIFNAKKYPAIEYRGVSDRAWLMIAKELGISEAYLKGRWTNIKGCFKRYLKNIAKNKKTKKYYLAEYLNFMIPFMNVKLDNCELNNTASNAVEVVNLDNFTNGSDSDSESELMIVESEEEEEENISVSQELNQPVTFEPVTSNSADSESVADWHFLTSFLPDMQKMTQQQKSKFRNALLTSIDTILYGEL